MRPALSPLPLTLGSVLALGPAAPALAAPAPAPAAATAEAKSGAPRQFDAVRAVITRLVEEGKVPSIAVAVVKDGRIVWEEGFGWADRERKVPATAGTAYSIASLTKPITATAIMRLHQRGTLDIDAPIERYLGGIRLTPHAGPTEQVTARRIMAHSAGLPTYGHFYLDGSTPAGSKETISTFGMTVFPANSRFNYSNIGMKILDAAIEQVSGRSYGDYLKREVFGPLGMSNSAVGLPANTAAATRYDGKGKAMGFYLTDHPGSGDVWSSAHDMARFLAFHMGTPLAGQKAVLTKQSRLAMQQPASAGPSSSPGEPRTDVGANWMVSAVNGHPHLWHSGGQPGSNAYMAFYPAQKLGIVVLANGSAQLFPITQGIRKAIGPEVAPSEDEPPLPPAAPIPFKGRWSGSVVNAAGAQPISLAFDGAGAVTAQLGNQAPASLQRVAFAKGALTGQFSALSDHPDAGKAPHTFSLDLVPVGGELVGQMVLRRLDSEVALLLPSFVRLRPEEPRKR